MAIWPFRPSRAGQDAESLLAAVTAASRQPSLYGIGKVSDTLQGRFELMTLHAALVLIRLRAEPAAGPLAQAFTDKLFRFFDAGLREDGVGDLTVPKRMQALAGAFYGRVEAYGAALDAGGDPLQQAIGRNVLGDEMAAFAAPLAAHAKSLTARLASVPVGALWSAEAWTPA